MESAKMLVVDDDEAIRSLLGRLLDQLGYPVAFACDGQEAWELFQQQNFDVVISDLEMPRMSGQDLMEKVKDKSPDTPFIIITGHSTLESTRQAVRLGADEYLYKPFGDVDELGFIISKSFSYHKH